MEESRPHERLWDWNLVSNRMHISAGWLALVGVDQREVCNSPSEWLLRVHPEDLETLEQELEAAKRGDAQTFQVRHRLRHKDGTYRWTVCHGAVVRDPGGQVLRLTGSHDDVTAETVTDVMTGLPSRLLLIDRVSRGLTRSTRHGHLPFALLLLGLDHSAEPAATAGGHIDAPLLTAVARRLETSLRRRDRASLSLLSNDAYLVARLEDNYFGIVLEGLSELGDSTATADRLLADLQPALTVAGRHVYVSASIGIAVSVTGYASAEAMLHDADTALHRARVLGGGRSAIFDTAILHSEQTSLRLEHEFPSALERGEFQLVYQPIVALETRRILGFEALVRWHHPSIGLVAPGDFIPAAERTGFIVTLGLWVLRQACMQLKAWQQAVPSASDLWMSVNLSSVQLKQPTVVDDISAIARECQVKPRTLMLELTETVACENPVALKTVLMQLRALGLRISIDDFGTGYSSLSYLRQFPVDALKIDRSFLHGLESQDDTAAIVGSMTSMARQLGLHVVVEGIERDEQVRRLLTLQCESGQGYLFAGPVDVHRARQLLEEGSLAPASQESAREHQWTPQSATTTRREPVLTTRARRWFGFAAVAVVVLALAGVANRYMHDSAVPSVTSLVPSRAPSVDVPLTSVERDATPATDEAPGRPPTNSESPPPSALARARSFRVQHLHRFGRCVGRLTPSRRGLAFVPDHKSDDAFVLARDQFQPSTEDRTLIIRTQGKTYRFRPEDQASPRLAAERLQALVEAVVYPR